MRVTSVSAASTPSVFLHSDKVTGVLAGRNELDALAIAGAGEGDVNDRAAWSVLARAILNLDETVTKG